MFSWIVALGKLLTCDNMQKRWPLCALCSNWSVFGRNNVENQDCILLHYSFVSVLLSKVVNELSFTWIASRSEFHMFLIDSGQAFEGCESFFWNIIAYCIF